MYGFTQKNFKKIAPYAFLAIITSDRAYGAHHLEPNRIRNNNVYIVIEKRSDSISTPEKNVPIVSIKYATQKINSGGCTYSMENIINLINLKGFYSCTVAKMENSEQSSIDFLGLTPQQEKTSVAVCESDTLLVSPLNNNPIMIRKKNPITNQIVTVAEFKFK